VRGWKALTIEEVEARPWVGTDLAWHPLREALGTRIVGMAAFSADRVGQEVVEAHRETEGGLGHEEVYVVMRGRASFVLDGEPLDAPAGTFVKVDPDVHRAATAAEADTIVLALGGYRTFRPSASEWIERARPYARTDPREARRIVDELRAARPDSVGVEIAEALLAAGQGDVPAARRYLRAAIDQDPAVRPLLRDDPDLGPLLDSQR
jgi:hypothetical protein